MSSGLTARRLILQQIAAVVQHGPFRSSLGAALVHCATTTTTTNTVRVNDARQANGGGGGNSRRHSWISSFLIRPECNRAAFTLITEEEMAYLRRRREEDGDEGRVVLSTRPTRHLLRGLAGSSLNVLLSFLLSPLLGLSVALEVVRLRGVRPTTLFVAPAVGVMWGAVFFAVACYAAAQQLLLCALYQIMAPVVYLGNGSIGGGCCSWSDLTCRYEHPSGVLGHTHPLLALYEPEQKMRERAMKRDVRRRRSDKSNVLYEGKKDGQGSQEGDYYAVLGVTPDATAQQIKEAYNRLVLKVHPDKNPGKSAADHFDAVTKAYRVLGNAERRRKYDVGGKSAVDKIGERKRDAVRALFGGDAMHAIVGDVKTGSFSQRVVDGLDWTQEELAVQRQRMRERCRDELLTSYLQPLQDAGSGVAGLGELKERLRRLLSTGLAKEVLHAVGQEYLRVVRYSEAGDLWQRLQLFLREVGPHRARQRLNHWRCLSGIRKHTFKDSAALVDLAWYTSVEELEHTARWVATAILLDPSLPEKERQRRCDAMRVLGETFVAHGQVYQGANKQTMDTLMNSLREYHHQQQRGQTG